MRLDPELVRELRPAPGLGLDHAGKLLRRVADRLQRRLGQALLHVRQREGLDGFGMELPDDVGIGAARGKEPQPLRGIDREAGFTDIGNFIGTFGYGINDRTEFFASIRFVTRIDRDFRPLLLRPNDAGGPVNDYPLVRVDNFPYCGVKASGRGREGVRYAMEEMTEPRVLVTRR